MSSGFYAHTKYGVDTSGWHTLETHLSSVAAAARRFAEPFGAGAWAAQAGLLHDVGKYSEAFQAYLRLDPIFDPRRARIDHSTAGGQYAVAEDAVLGHLLAYPVTGHHSGLLDGTSKDASLERRLSKDIEPVPEWPGGSSDLSIGIPGIVLRSLSAAPRDSFSLAFFVRMLFSCLVDADCLDTERFRAPEKAAERPDWPCDNLDQMEAALRAHVAAFGPPQTYIARKRESVRRACLSAASRFPGLFSLTVPTGGGKTLSSLAFALRHARLHGLRRVVYVVPFTSIIEQNAGVFRDVFATITKRAGADPVVEHHSNVDAGREKFSSRLATENWDAPIIVTTAVQFYESLFASRPSRCRKLHNLAESVIVLDEAQTLPVNYLAPCLAALRELTDNYGATVMLCSATQPAIRRTARFPIGLDIDNEIIPDAAKLFADLKRVEVKQLGYVADAALVARLLRQDQVLCIVNTRNHARVLFAGLGEAEGHFHLSALMCPAHRSQVLERIQQRLVSGQTCRVVSTQLIEAGVDIDFPCVYRSMAGLDSIAQAAGRCNRNGRAETARTFVFRSEHWYEERYFSDTANAAAQILACGADPLSLEATKRYFEVYYGDQSDRWDEKAILDAFHILDLSPLQLADGELPFDFRFKTVAKNFRLIESIQKPVIIPWGPTGSALCDRLRRFADSPSRDLLRRLQRYTVQISEQVWDQNIGEAIDLVGAQYPILVSFETNYSDQIGLALGRGALAEGGNA